MKCSMNEDDEEDVFLGDNPMNSCRRNRQQQQTNDRKQSFIYAFPTPSIYDDQNFCYRSWRVPPFQQTTATTGVNSNYNDGDDNFNYNNNNYNNKQYLLQTKHKRAYTVDYISRYIFPISFIVLNIIYWTYYLEVLVTLS